MRAPPTSYPTHNKKPKQIDNMRVMVVDARDRESIKIYAFTVDEDAPELLRSRLISNRAENKTNYNNVYFDDGVNGMDDLLTEDDEEEDEEEVQVVQEYIESCLVVANRLEAPFTDPIDISISLVEP